jgi:hypothetical protein
MKAAVGTRIAFVEPDRTRYPIADEDHDPESRAALLCRDRRKTRHSK